MIYGKLNGSRLEQAPYHMVKNKVDYCGYNFDSNRGWPASVYGGYGTKDINGYGKLQYVRMKQ